MSRSGTSFFRAGRMAQLAIYKPALSPTRVREHARLGLGVTDLPDYRSKVLYDLPALYWRLGEPAGGTAFDETHNDRDGVYAGVAVAAAGALIGDADTAVSLDGVDDVIDGAPYIPFPSATVSRTLEIWAKRQGAGDTPDTFWGTQSGGGGGHLK